MFITKGKHFKQGSTEVEILQKESKFNELVQD